MTIGALVMPRAFKTAGVFVPFPLPGLPISHIISFGSRIVPRPPISTSLDEAIATHQHPKDTVLKLVPDTAEAEFSIGYRCMLGGRLLIGQLYMYRESRFQMIRKRYLMPPF